MTQSYFKVPKDFRLNTTHFLLQKFQIKENFEKLNHSSGIKTKDFINIYKECTIEPCSFFINDTMLTSNNPLRFRKILF